MVDARRVRRLLQRIEEDLAFLRARKAIAQRFVRIANGSPH